MPPVYIEIGSCIRAPNVCFIRAPIMVSGSHRLLGTTSLLFVACASALLLVRGGSKGPLPLNAAGLRVATSTSAGYRCVTWPGRVKRKLSKWALSDSLTEATWV